MSIPGNCICSHVEHVLQNSVLNEIQIRNVISFGNIIKVPDSEVRTSGLSLDP